ncbi:S-adenosyl-L-methionine-dependent tRNA 4-demethylwyosine synthase TYW1-like isoform 1-T1 [Guaruba guarouba]
MGDYDPDDCLLEEVGRNIDRWLWMLSASRVMTHAEGDCNVAQSKHGTTEADFEAWKAKFVSRLQALCRGEKKPCSGNCKKGKCKSPGKQSMESSDHEHGALEYENTEVKAKSVGPYFWFSTL